MSEDSKRRASKRTMAVLLVAVLLGVGGAVGVFLFSRDGGAGSRPLPPGCAKPADGFLIVASGTGYNDSIGHGAPDKNWPVVTVHQGENVTIVVCNIDVQAHGFQIAHYYDSSGGHGEVTISPGQVIEVSFVANRVGSFDIYCEIFCTIHVYMQSGLLNVTAS